MSDESKNAQDVEGRVADSIGAAAGMTEYSEQFLQKLKALGCSAFRNGRVHVDELESYVADNNLEGLEKILGDDDALAMEIRRERLRSIRFKNDTEEGRFIRKEQIADRVSEIGTDLKQRLRTALEDELPQRIQGKPAAEIRVIMRDVVDRLCDEFSGKTKEWTK